MINQATDIVQRDFKHLWHPCMQMKDFETLPLLAVKNAKGPYLELMDGRKIIDAISSWWCKSLGHGHPRLKAALKKQLKHFEHVILANTTHSVIVELGEKLASLTKTLNKMHFTSDGSSAVEMALKMALHAQQILGATKKNRFMALSNSYHGETCGALAVSDLGIYRAPYQTLLFNAEFLQNIPYVQSRNDKLWYDCNEHWWLIEKQLEKNKETLCAIIIEPILQGSGGMKIYSQDLLGRLRHWTLKNNIYLIADEILTGLGRTGLPLACQYAEIEPDFLCLGKGLTAGFIPMSTMLTTQEIYDLFYDDYGQGKDFLHSHTYAGHALGAAVAVEVLNILFTENIFAEIRQKEPYLKLLMDNVANNTKKLNNVRSIGMMVAADLCDVDGIPRAGYQVAKQALEKGALLRPLGNTIYWLPPFNTDVSVLEQLAEITESSINSI